MAAFVCGPGALRIGLSEPARAARWRTDWMGLSVVSQGGRASRRSHVVTRRGDVRMEVDHAKMLEVRTREIFMPALSSTMTEGRIVQWLKSEGDFVEAGEMVMVVESDKADMDVEAFESGYLATILVEEGAACNVGSTVALLAETEADIEAVRDCGLECIVSGSGSRHDGTTAVDEPSSSLATSSPVSSPDPPAPETSPPATAPSDPAVPLEKPEFFEIFMPALSSTMTEGKVVDWSVSEGDEVTQGDMVLTVESDKADMEVESFESGFVAYIPSPAGSTGKVGETIGYLAPSKDDIPSVKAYAEALHTGGSSVETPAPAAPAPEKVAPDAPAAAPPAPATTAPVINTGRIVASPYAKKVAKEIGVDLRTVRGTGDNGRIQEADVRAAASSGIAVPQVYKAKTGKVVATPEAKKLAKVEKVDLAKVDGTGNFGRITADDVLRAAGKAPVSAAPESKPDKPAPSKKEPESREAPAPLPSGAVPMNAMQKAVAKNMAATMDVPVFRAAYSIKTTALDELYAKLKPKGVTLSALLAKAVAITLEKHPIMNARYGNDSIVYNAYINVAMAVALPDGGLITPVLQKANTVDIYSLSRSWKDLIQRAKDKKLSPPEYTSGTFIISNLGMYGVDTFDAILPQGVGSILAVAGSKPVVGIGSNGLISVEKQMTVNITCDHRHIHGAQAAEFLRELASLLESNTMELLM